MATTKTAAATKTQAPQPAPTGNLPAVQGQMKTFMQEFRARQRAYQPLLPPHVPFDKFEASVRAAVTKDPELVTKCIPATLFRAAAEAAELGLSLSPTLREADILKVYNSRLGGTEAQFRPRFMGLMKLAKQSGEIKDITAHEVYEWDEFDYEHGLNERLIHKPTAKPMDYATKPCWGVIAAYCIWTEQDGTKKFEVMELADIVRIMNRSSSKTKEGVIVGPWVNDFPEMCRKTVVRRASKYMPLSAERMRPFATAVNLDDRREGGEEITLDHGDIMDVTADAEPQAQPQQTQAGKSQMDNLEAQMQGKKPEPKKAAPAKAPVIDNPPQPPKQQQAPVSVAKIEVPVIDGKKDLNAWITLAQAEVEQMDTAAKQAWRALHENILEACEYTCPDEIEALLKALQ